MAEAPAPAPPTASFLATPRGKLTLAFLCVIALLDFLDTSVVNVALPSIQRDLHFSQQGLQWVLSGYVVSYGGFLLLGGRLAASGSPRSPEARRRTPRCSSGPGSRRASARLSCPRRACPC
jgi:MFS family permease